MGVERKMGLRSEENGRESVREGEAKLQGLAGSFHQTDSRLQLPRWEVCVRARVCVYPVTQIPLCLCTFFFLMCVRAEACDLARSG